MIAMFCGMSCIFVLGNMIPTYLSEYVGLKPLQMGFVTSGLGVGGFIGGVIVPAASDYLGRRLVLRR